MSYSIQKLTKPDPLQVVSVEELSLHLGLNTHDDDELLETYIEAAYELFEIETDGYILQPTTFAQYLTDWDMMLRLERGNVSEVIGMSYYDENDELQPVDDFGADLTQTPAYVYPGDAPSLSVNVNRPVVVEFVAGPPEADSSGSHVPKSIKLAIMLLAAHYYANREAFTTDSMNETPLGFRRVCDAYRTSLGDTF